MVYVSKPFNLVIYFYKFLGVVFFKCYPIFDIQRQLMHEKNNEMFYAIINTFVYPDDQNNNNNNNNNNNDDE